MGIRDPYDPLHAPLDDGRVAFGSDKDDVDDEVSTIRKGRFGNEVEDRPRVHGVSGELVNDAVDRLREYLRGELSAVETYELAMRSISDIELTRALRQLRDSHDQRVTLIRDRIRSLGGEPDQSSGAWGTFAKIVQRGADLFGDAAAMNALEEGEDHGLKMYLEDVGEGDQATRTFVRTELLPAQQRTHDLCRSLERFVKAA